MAYCVNCGVKLTPPETVCPLCGVEMYNPKETHVECRSRYPQKMERISAVNRQFAAMTLSLLLLAPACICLLLNLLLFSGYPWSLFVIGSLCLIFLFFLLPILFKNPHPLLCVAIDTVAVGVFLLMVDIFCTPGQWRWFLLLGLPLAAGAGLIVLVLIFLSRFSYFKPVLRITAYTLFFIGVYTVGIEMLLLGFFSAPCVPIWSWIPFAACLFTAFFCLFLNKSRRWQEAVHKRFFV